MKNIIFIDEWKIDIFFRYISIVKFDMKYIMDVISIFVISYDGYIFKEVGFIINF